MKIPKPTNFQKMSSMKRLMGMAKVPPVAKPIKTKPMKPKGMM